MKWFRFNKSNNLIKNAPSPPSRPVILLSFFIGDFFPDGNETERQKCSQTASSLASPPETVRTVTALTALSAGCTATNYLIPQRNDSDQKIPSKSLCEPSVIIRIRGLLRIIELQCLDPKLGRRLNISLPPAETFSLEWVLFLSCKITS